MDSWIHGFWYGLDERAEMRERLARYGGFILIDHYASQFVSHYGNLPPGEISLARWCKFLGMLIELWNHRSVDTDAIQ